MKTKNNQLSFNKEAVIELTNTTLNRINGGWMTAGTVQSTSFTGITNIPNPTLSVVYFN